MKISYYICTVFKREQRPKIRKFGDLEEYYNQ